MNERILELPARVASAAPRDLADARRIAAGLSASARGATAIEWRLDLASEPLSPAALLELDPRPAILTLRSAREGGSFSGSGEEYRRRVEEAYDAGATVDVEHASGLLASAGFLPDRRRVVVSAHYPFGLPDGVEDLLGAMAASGALAVKLVAGAATLPEAFAASALQAVPRPFPASIFPMGPASAPGRILSAHAGGALVFGSLAGTGGPGYGEAPTARGQVPISELVAVYGVDRPAFPEALFGIVAGDASASLSPRVHNSLFRARGLRYLYLPLPTSDFGRERPTDLSAGVPFRGFSVTRPWKLAASGAGVPSEDVRATGAANTLVLRRDRWRAENTDVDGIFDPLADHDTGEGRSAIVLGAGGTARAAILAARRIGYEIAVCARRVEAADALAEELRVDAIAWEDLPDTEADLYVNATPVGGLQGDPPAFPGAVLERRPLVFDCVYRRGGGETPTVAAARRAKCPVVDGLQMFAAQAVRQARLFGVADVRQDEVEALVREERP